jgi:hypothetical protein
MTKKPQTRPSMFIPKKRGQHGQDRRMIFWVILALAVLVGLALLIRQGT